MLIFAFFLGALALVLQGLIIPHIAILAFAPFLALCILRCDLIRALWLSALCGCMVDVLSEDPIGLHALNYVLTTAALYRLRNPFSYEQPLHLSLFTGFISFFSTFLLLILLFLFDRRVPFAGRWVFADLIGMPVIDALYAFVWFAPPLALANKIVRTWIIFWLKRKNLSPISR